MIAQIILLIIIIIIAILIIPHARQIIGSSRSKTEARVVAILESLTGHKFDQAHPQWLHDNRGTILELDGFNEELRLAVEVQGPGHIKPLASDAPAPYKKYYERIARDKLKRELCARNHITLITVDYRISARNLALYLRSRLFDAGIIREKPRGYIYAYDMRPDETY